MPTGLNSSASCGTACWQRVVAVDVPPKQHNHHRHRHSHRLCSDWWWLCHITSQVLEWCFQSDRVMRGVRWVSTDQRRTSEECHRAITLSERGVSTRHGMACHTFRASGSSLQSCLMQRLHVLFADSPGPLQFPCTVIPNSFVCVLFPHLQAPCPHPAGSVSMALTFA